MSAKARSARRVRVASLEGEVLTLDADAAHYVVHVLRLRVGDSLEAFDGKGALARAELVEVTHEAGVRVRIDERLVEEPLGVALHVALATPKGERADWAIEKLTELGVARIVWLTCERSVVMPKGANRHERWRRLAEAAARQCGRSRLPVIEGPVDLTQFVVEPAHHKLVADPSAEVNLWRRAAELDGEAHLLVGPEGGLTMAELAAATAAGYTAVRLAPYVLRVETAAVSGAATIVAAAMAKGSVR
ncbi:MAG: RsmE family RNA methyltransferase [Myxococcota bacterium]